MTAPRILFVSGFFPPYSPLGAVRAPMLAAYWHARGHDVRVIAVENPEIKGMIDMPIPAEHVRHIPYDPDGGMLQATVDGLKSVARLGRGSGTGGGDGGANGGGTANTSADLSSLKRLYRQAAHYPDRYWSWIKPAVAAGIEIARDFQPDVIYSSAPPHSGHIVAQKLSEKLGLPWVAELRDPWAKNPHDVVHPLIAPFRQRLAHTTLRRAAACIAVTSSLAEENASDIGQPTTVSYNGYGADDFAGMDRVEPYDADKLTIIHAGAIYAERRDPTPLFQAIAMLGDDADAIRVVFFHDEGTWVRGKALEHGVESCVEMRDPVPRKEILAQQRAVDVLLMCRWDHPDGDTLIPGKLFEYIGARRPILSIGSRTGEAADIIRRGDFGVVENDAAKIAEHLRHWLAEKRANDGRVPDMPAEPTVGYLRETQFEKIDAVIEQVLARPGG